MGLFDRFGKRTNAQQQNTTVLNEEMNAGSTVLNREVGGNATVLNQDVAETPEFLGKGMKLCGDYTVTGELNVNAGEADLLTCEKDGKTYIAKVYRRQAAIKDSVAKKLQSLHSPYVVRTYATGSVEGYPVEIIEYYRNGSLDGKKFDKKTLKEMVIPCLNEGLHVLHQNDIIHKDLKPSNIMLSDDKKSVVILDFGISSMRDEGSTVIVTRTGLTPEYSAPETFRNLFLNESDYYSLGITLYELITRRTPYEGLGQEELEQMTALQKIPFPEGMDEELKELIQGLTYQDITNRRDKENPNRRWGYEEVKNWLAGVKQVIPGTSHAQAEVSFRPIEFCGKKYTTFESLLDAMNENWEDGKKLLFRDTLARHFSRIDPDISDIIWDAQDQLSDSVDQDVLFFRTLYKMKPELKEFRWKGKKYRDLQAFGRVWIEDLKKQGKKVSSLAEEMLSKGVFSAYLESVAPKEKESIKVLKTAEAAQRAKDGKQADKELNDWKLAYLLSGDKTMQIEGKVFGSPDEIADYLILLLKKSRGEMERFGEKLLDQNGKLNPQFEAWLLAIGREKELEKWRNSSV